MFAPVQDLAKSQTHESGIVRRPNAVPEESLMLHGPAEPCGLRVGEVVRCRVSLEGIEGQHSLEVWKLSAMAIEVELPYTLAFQVHAGQELSMELAFGGQQFRFDSLVIGAIFNDNFHSIAGIKLWPAVNAGAANAVRPEAPELEAATWAASARFSPVAVCQNLHRFHDEVPFAVDRIHGRGMRVSTFRRDAVLLPGMVLDMRLSFPMGGQHVVRCRAEQAAVVESESSVELVFDFAFVDAGRAVRESIGQYLLRFGQGSEASPLGLERSGYLVRSTAESITCETVKTAEQMREVLALRKKSYAEAGKVSADCSLEDMADEYDERSRILMVRVRGRLVASTRLIFNSRPGEMEHEQFIEWPKEFPPQDQVLELTRVCTDPDYRGRDVLPELFRRAALVIAQSKRPWVIGSATKKLVGIYEKAWFSKATQHTYRHASLNNEEHIIFIGNFPRVMACREISPLAWNLMWNDVSDYLDRSGLIELTSYDRVRLKAIRTLHPLAERWRRRRMDEASERRFRRFLGE